MSPGVEVASAPSPSPRARLLRFGLVGASGVLVNLGLLYLLVHHTSLHYALAAVVAIEASILSNFLGNRHWTWRDRATTWHALAAFHGVSLVGMAIQWVTLVASVELFGIHYLIGSLAGIGIATTWNFVAHHHFTFAEPDSPIRRQFMRPALYAGALLIHLVVASMLTHHWDTWVFETSARQFLSDGITPYETAELSPDYIWMGLGHPGQAQWYAYPPLPLLLMSVTFWPVTAGLADPAWVARLLIKLPFIAGTLLLAFTAHRVTSTAPGPDAQARAIKLERILLFSPLLFVITDAWGMFEGLMVACLLASVLAIRNDRPALGGLLWAAATLLKIFPVYLVPVLAVYLVRRSGWQTALRYFGAAFSAIAVVSLPFYLAAPHGYLQQILLMHGARAPTGFSPLGAIYSLFAYWGRQFFSNLSTDGLIAGFGLFSLGATAAALALTAVASARRPATERNLLFFVAASMCWALFLGKVLNEQYFVLPLGLLLAFSLHPEPEPALEESKLRRLIGSLNWVMAGAALLASAHYMRFIPPDIARKVFRTDVLDAMAGMGRPFGWNAEQVEGISATMAYLLVFGVFWFGRSLLRPTLGAGLHILHEYFRPIKTLQRLSTRTSRLTVALLALLALPSLAVGIVVQTNHAPTPSLEAQDGPLAGLIYRVDWRNPSYDPLIQYGAWEAATQVPYEGYYSLSTHAMTTDLVEIKRQGFDYVLGLHNPDLSRASGSLGMAAVDAGLPFALLLDARTLITASDVSRLGLDGDASEEFADLLASPIGHYWEHPALLRLGPDERLPIFLAGIEAVGPDFSEAEGEFVADLRRDLDPAASSAAPPQNAAELAQNAGAWGPVYLEAERRFWRQAFAFLDANHRYTLFLEDAPGAVLLESLPPGIDVDVGPTFAGPARVAAAFARSSTTEAAYARLESSQNAPSIALVVPAFNASLALPGSIVHAAVVDGALAYDGRWADVVSNASIGHVHVHSWNEFDQGNALEPTLEYGHVLRDRTAPWLAAFHDPDHPRPARWGAGSRPLGPDAVEISQAPYPLDLLAAAHGFTEP